MMGIILLLIAFLSVAGVSGYLYLRKRGIVNSGWRLDSYSKNTTLDTNPSDGSILKFKFPQGDGVHTVIKSVQGVKADRMSMTFEITGNNPVFGSPNAGATPQLHLHIAGNRHWSNYQHRADLRVGKQTLNVPMTPDCWSDVNGHPATDNVPMFEQAVKNALAIGFTCGDEHGYAHGAWLERGDAEFRLISFSP